MRKVILFVSVVTLMSAMTSCKDNPVKNDRYEVDRAAKQEKEFINSAIRHHSDDMYTVQLVGNTVVYTHIFDGIVDVKTYTYEGDVCIEAERVYTFPNQMMALRHYRDAVERAELYDNIVLLNREVKYDLKDAQHKLETDGLTKEQLKSKFENDINKAKADVKSCEEKCKDKCKSKK